MPYLRNSIAYDHDFWYTSVKWWYLSVFFFFFLKFSFFRLLGGKRGKKWPKMTKNYVWCTSYLRNHISYDCHLWYTSVKWWWCYLQVFFSFFQNFNSLGCHWSSFVVHNCKMIISPGDFLFFQNFEFLGC